MKVSGHNISSSCGLEAAPTPALFSPYIVGGEEASPHSWPWTVAVFIDSAWFCGGSLISEHYVLTAAHCAEGAAYFDLLLGVHDITATALEAGSLEITSYQAVVHPAWNPLDLSGDLALISLPSPVVFTDYISPVCLSARRLGQEEEVCLTGWGREGDSTEDISPVLRQVCSLPPAPCPGVPGQPLPHTV